MTSRNFFFNLLKEDIKRKLWAVCLAFLSFFFWMPVLAAMRISDAATLYERWIANGITFEGITPEVRHYQKLMEAVPEVLGLGNPMNAMTIGCAALVMAITGFMYLHSRKQVDFHHSLPVRRDLIFAAKYLNGILIVLSMYLLNMILGIGVFAVNGLEIPYLLQTALPAFAVHAAGYLIIYGLMVIAVLLTGNFFVSILGGIVLFSYVPAVVGLVNSMMSLFFVTYNSKGFRLEDLLLDSSPIAYYVKLVADGSSMETAEYGTLMTEVLACTAVFGVMTAVALILYKKRPSESAGKAMAFRLTMAPIKIMLVVPITLAISILFWDIYDSIPWTVFGFVFGLVVTHSIIEVIYHFEFRKLFANLPQMGLAGILTLAIFAVFRYDLAGYERYKPEMDKLESASIYAFSLYDWQDYGLPYRHNDQDVTYTSWKYLSADEYVSDNMYLTDKAVIETIVDAGIAEAQHARAVRYDGAEEHDRTDGYRTRIDVGYRLKNGRTVYRYYEINVLDILETVETMYVSPEYKTGVYPVLSYKGDQITGIYEYRQSEIYPVEGDRAFIEELLTVYQEELTALTLKDRSEEIPVTSLRFLTEVEYEYLKYISHSRNKNYTGDFKIEDMDHVNVFPVYPSFTKTLELLEKAGNKPETAAPEDVLRIEIFSHDYTDENAYYDAEEKFYQDTAGHYTETVSAAVPVEVLYGARTIVLNNDGSEEMTACIQEVLDHAHCDNLIRMNQLTEIEYGISVRVYMKDANKGKREVDQEYVPYLFAPDEIPQFVRDAYRYDDRKSKNINLGIQI